MTYSHVQAGFAMSCDLTVLLRKFSGWSQTDLNFGTNLVHFKSWTGSFFIFLRPMPG